MIASDTAVPSKATPTRYNNNIRQRREALWFYVFISPWLIGFLVLTIAPLVFGFYISLTNYNGINLDNLKFLGFENYQRAFEDPKVQISLERTVIFTVVNAPLSVGLSLAIAYLLTLDIPLKGVFRTLFYLPHIIPLVAAIWMWQLLFEKNFGLVNAAVSLFSPGQAIGWLVDYPTETLILLTTWLGLGGGMVIFIAGLQGIPRELQDAAKVDGATHFGVFRNVTIPLLTPVIFFQLVMALIGSLRELIAPILLSPSYQGGLNATVPRDNRFFLVNAYSEIFAQGRFGYGSALIWLLFLFILIITVALMFSTRYWVYYEND